VGARGERDYGRTISDGTMINAKKAEKILASLAVRVDEPKRTFPNEVSREKKKKKRPKRKNAHWGGGETTVKYTSRDNCLQRWTVPETEEKEGRFLHGSAKGKRTRFSTKKRTENG